MPPRMEEGLAMLMQLMRMMGAYENNGVGSLTTIVAMHEQVTAFFEVAVTDPTVEQNLEAVLSLHELLSQVQFRIKALTDPQLPH